MVRRFDHGLISLLPFCDFTDSGSRPDSPKPGEPSVQKKTVAALATGTVLALGLGTVGLNEALAKTVTVSIDGTPTQVRTYAGSVGKALAEDGVQLGEHDVVAPSVDTRLTEGTQISVQYARPVTVTLDGQERTIWTTATSVDQVLSMLQVSDDQTLVSTSRSAGIGREGLAFSVTTPKDVSLVIDGKTKAVSSTVRTVDDLLKEQKVTVGATDKVEPGRTTVLTDGLRVSVTKPPAPKPTPTKTTATKSATKSTTTKASTAAKTTTAPKASTAAASTASNSVWDQIAQCESGGNWAINTGNGYYGGLQFNLSTWQAYGGTGMPSAASKATQIAIASKVQAAQGWGAWPACTSKLGLR